MSSWSEVVICGHGHKKFSGLVSSRLKLILSNRYDVLSTVDFPPLQPAAPPSNPPPDPTSVVRVNVQSEEEIQLLQALETQEEWELDFWLHPVSTELPVDIRVPRSSLSSVKEYLSAHNIPFTVMIDNLQEVLDAEKAEMEENQMKERSTRTFNFGAYHRLETIYNWMDTLVTQHPNLVTKQEIGRSYENRPISALVATSVLQSGLTQESTPGNGFLRLLECGQPTSTPPEAFNLQGPRETMCLSSCLSSPGASKNPCSDSYHGPSAHSEIEVKNVVNLIKSHGNFKSFISVHAYSQLLMYPYGYSCRNVPHQPELDSVSRAAVQKLTTLYGTRYKVGSICKIIYQASGGSIDWSYNLGIKYSFAFELRDTGRYGFILPANQIIPTASETWLALKHIM
ncbi:hypothetical protein INR49_017535, partial [Caranx melampygus]